MNIGSASSTGATGKLDTSPALQLATIAEVGAKIAGARSREAILRTLFTEARWLINFARCALALGAEGGTVRGFVQSVATAGPQETVVPRLSNGPIEQVLAQRQPLRIDDLQANWPDIEAELPVLGGATRSALLLPLAAEGETLGVLIFCANRIGAYPSTVLGIAQLLAIQIASAVRTVLLLDELDGHENVILSLALAIEAKDPYTEGHCARLADYAALLGRDLGMDEREIEQLRMGATLHDIGKIAVPEAVLRKPEALTEEEQRIFREHPIAGERICRPLRSARSILPAIRHHHERWDGLGYPDRLRGEAIPLAARIIGLVDAFDAMTSDRPYRAGMPRARALDILRANAGPQWDPALVERFVRLMEPRLAEPAARQADSYQGRSLSAAANR